MRRSGTWMELLDERLLEWMLAEGWASPRVLASEPAFEDYTQHRLRDRLEVLAHAELAAPIVDGTDMFEITTWGILYLEGELDAAYHHPERENIQVWHPVA